MSTISLSHSYPSADPIYLRLDELNDHSEKLGKQEGSLSVSDPSRARLNMAKKTLLDDITSLMSQTATYSEQTNKAHHQLASLQTKSIDHCAYPVSKPIVLPKKSDCLQFQAEKSFTACVANHVLLQDPYFTDYRKRGTLIAEEAAKLFADKCITSDAITNGSMEITIEVLLEANTNLSRVIPAVSLNVEQAVRDCARPTESKLTLGEGFKKTIEQFATQPFPMIIP